MTEILSIAGGVFVAWCLFKSVTFDFLDYLALKEGLTYRKRSMPLKTVECGSVSLGWKGSTVGCLLHFYPDSCALQQRGDSEELVLDVGCFRIVDSRGKEKIFGLRSGLELRFDGYVEKALIPWFHQRRAE